MSEDSEEEPYVFGPEFRGSSVEETSEESHAEKETVAEDAEEEEAKEDSELTEEEEVRQVNAAIERMKRTGEDFDTAEDAIKKGKPEPVWGTRSPLEKCMEMRAYIYNEDTETCRQTCKEMMNNPAYAHILISGDTKEIGKAFFMWEAAHDSKWKKHRTKITTGFRPSLVRFECCSLCGRMHPTRAILPSGKFASFNLSSYHSDAEARLWLRKIAEDTHAATGLTRLQICTRSRMELYGETPSIAEGNCKLILEDPLYRHLPPGLTLDPNANYENTAPFVVPVEIDDRPGDSGNPEMNQLEKCFQKKMEETPEASPQEIIKACMTEIEFKREEKKEKVIVDLYGKSRQEIDSMREKPQGPGLTVGDLYGKTRKNN